MAGRATLSEIFLRASWSITPRISDGVNSRSLIFSVLVVTAFNFSVLVVTAFNELTT